MITGEEIRRAAGRLAPHVRRTELQISEPLSERADATVAVKAEHRQLTGSFKLRGALNKILTLEEGVQQRGVVTASSGNHGIAVATAAELVGIDCTVYLPATVSPTKRSAVERLGAAVVAVDSADAFQAEVLARAEAEATGLTYVSPYNDAAVVTGQGTVGLEIDVDAESAHLEVIDAVVVAVGGGGLVSGVASWLKAARPEVTIVGASPANDQAMAASVAAGSVLETTSRPTFSDGTAGGIEAGTITFEMCASLVDTWITVSEHEIAKAVASRLEDHGDVIEGAAGVALAAAEQWGTANSGASVVAVSCGGNVTSASMQRMLTEADRDV